MAVAESEVGAGHSAGQIEPEAGAARSVEAPTPALPRPVAPLSPFQRTWNDFIGLIKDFGEIAKFVALLLAIAGFIGLYFPTARTQFEMLTGPSAWYYIGAVKTGRS